MIFFLNIQNKPMKIKWERGILFIYFYFFRCGRSLHYEIEKHDLIRATLVKIAQSNRKIVIKESIEV